MAETHTPVIISALLTPNPAEAGKPVLISVAALDIVSVPGPEVFYSGEFHAGEV